MTTTSYKGRALAPGPVRVHWHLKKHVWSIAQGGLVVAHADEFALEHATFIVQPAGRERVLRTGHRNVHAFAHGWPTDYICDGGTPVSYNPYRDRTFIEAVTGTPVSGARWLEFDRQGRAWATM